MPQLPELLLIIAVVVLIFGFSRIPALGDALGKAVKNFRGAMSKNEIDVTPSRGGSASAPAPPAAPKGEGSGSTPRRTGPA